MKEVILTVGPRAAGKSFYCKQTVERDRSIVYVSRDALLIERFGKTSLDPYSGQHEYVNELMWQLVKDHLQSGQEIQLILDTWNGSSGERQRIIHRLREFGADTVTAWYFQTPVNLVEDWFWRKPDVSSYPKDAPQKDHELYHYLATNIERDGFDRIIKVEPRID